MKRWCAEDGEFWKMLPVLLPSVRFQEHVSGEETMPSVLSDYPNSHLMFRISADVAILDENIPALQKPLQSADEFVELVSAIGTVILSPPNVIFS